MPMSGLSAEVRSASAPVAPSRPKAAATTATRRTFVPSLPLMDAPPRCQLRPRDRQQEVHARNRQDDQPVVEYLAQVRTHLIDSDQAIDPGFGWKDVSCVSREGGYRFFRPGCTDQKELGEAGSQE